MKKIIKASAVFLFLCVVTTASPSFATLCSDGSYVDAGDPCPASPPTPTPVAPTPPKQYTQDPFKAIMVGGEKLVKSGTQYSQKMLFGLAGLGATATGAMAFFGRFRWNRFFILVGALLMMASADYGVQYITGGKGSLEKLGN